MITFSRMDGSAPFPTAFSLGTADIAQKGAFLVVPFLPVLYLMTSYLPSLPVISTAE